MTNFYKYLNKVRQNYKRAVKIEWLNPDESVNFEFTDAMYDMSLSLNVNKQDGCRRTCSIVLNNDRNRFPIDCNGIWIGQKFKLWTGIYIDEETPCYFPQGVFYVNNPDEAYNPNSRTITINGVDKWAWLDGTLSGMLTATYQTNIGVNFYDAVRGLLTLSKYTNVKTDNACNMIDPIDPFLSQKFISKVDSSGNFVIECPYTATVERGKTFADVLKEYATILCANIYYDTNGRLTLDPMIDTADDITDSNKQIVWDYSTEDPTFLGFKQNYPFGKIYNDFIVLGNITNGYQFKGRVQNRNPASNTSVQRIGLKSKPPVENNQYVSDKHCEELAMYYAKTDTIMQKSATIESVYMPHIDVNKIVTVSTPNNRMSKEKFLITGISTSTLSKMTLSVTSINELKNFSVVTEEVWE